LPLPRLDEQKAYDELVVLCYECVLDNSAWRPLLELLVAASGRQQGLLLFTDYRKSGTHASTTLNLCDPSAIDVYNRHYCNLDPGLVLIRSHKVGEWYNDLMDFGPERIRRDPYYQEFYIPFGLHNLSCVKLEEQAESGIYLTVLNEVGAPLPTAQQQALLLRVSPHLLKAAKLSNKVNRLELELATRDLLLDHHPAPLWLLDGDGHVLYCNQMAARHMGQSTFPLYEHFSRLHSKSQDTHLLTLIRRAAGHSATLLACGPLSFDAQTGQFELDGLPLKLTAFEWRVLSALILRREVVVERLDLLERVYEGDADVDSNSLEVIVGRLRRKIGAERIETVRGRGYRLTAGAA